jgi:hypothetical protein
MFIGIVMAQRLHAGRKSWRSGSKETHNHMTERREKVPFEKLLSIFEEFLKH